jgi:hypothetical protein
MLNKYYVYLYLDPRKEGKFKYGDYEFDYEPFYVGKGHGNRLFEHLRPSRLNKTNGDVHNILGRHELDRFIFDNNLSLRRLLEFINKGVINKSGRTINTKNCIGWEIKKL